MTTFQVEATSSRTASEHSAEQVVAWWCCAVRTGIGSPKQPGTRTEFTAACAIRRGQLAWTAARPRSGSGLGPTAACVRAFKLPLSQLELEIPNYFLRKSSRLPLDAVRNSLSFKLHCAPGSFSKLHPFIASMLMFPPSSCSAPVTRSGYARDALWQLQLELEVRSLLEG